MLHQRRPRTAASRSPAAARTCQGTGSTPREQRGRPGLRPVARARAPARRTRAQDCSIGWTPSRNACRAEPESVVLFRRGTEPAAGGDRHDRQTSCGSDPGLTRGCAAHRPPCRTDGPEAGEDATWPDRAFAQVRGLRRCWLDCGARRDTPEMQGDLTLRPDPRNVLLVAPHGGGTDGLDLEDTAGPRSGAAIGSRRSRITPMRRDQDQRIQPQSLTVRLADEAERPV